MYATSERQCPKCNSISPMTARLMTQSVGDKQRGNGARTVLIAAILFLPLTFLAALLPLPMIFFWIADIAYGVWGIIQWMGGLSQRRVHLLEGYECTCPQCGFCWRSEN